MEVLSKIHRIDVMHFVNAYLLIDDELVLIDAGMQKSAKRIFGQIKKLGYKPEDIQTIIHTHYHIDHTGGTVELKNLTGARLAIHEKDARYLSGEVQGFSIPFMKNPQIEADILLKEGEKIGNLEVIHAPGHTPGSICLYNPEKGVIFSGDALQCGLFGGVSLPIKAFTEDMDEAKKSINKISRMEFDTMLPGHGKPIPTKASTKVKEFSSRFNS
ncbi:MAG: MBL fold metallo-hydrolase [Halobacteriota archaeon]|nr:MBL fold metallo-hydrolase [Halobacteriota archaeon]